MSGAARRASAPARAARRAGCGTGALEPASASTTIEVAGGVERQPLRPAEAGRSRRRPRRPARCDRPDRACRASARRRRGAPSGPKARWKAATLGGSDANARARPSAVDAQHRARPIADEQRAVGAERQAARDAEVGRIQRRAAVRLDAVDAAVEAARDVQPSVAIERQRRGVRHVADERLARAVGPDDEDRDRRLLAAGAAERDVEIAVAIVGRAVDVVHAGDERRADLDERRFARQLVDAGPASRPPSSPSRDRPR